MIKKYRDKFETLLFLEKNEKRQGEGGLRKQGYFKKSYEEKPLVSIVTVVYNGEKYLEDTIQSVLNQTYDNIEYIIIDGGSTDGTIDIIKKYEDKIDYWVSEKDAGIYDAMNKGISLCSGEIVGIINADDWYEKNSVEIIVSAYKECSNTLCLIHGIMKVYNKDGEYVGSRKGKDLPIVNFMTTPFKHPTCFVTLETYKKVGLYDTTYRLAADYDFMLRVIKNKANRIFVNKPITCLRQVGVTSGSKGVSAEDEILHIVKKYSRLAFFSNIFILYRKLRKYI